MASVRVAVRVRPLNKREQQLSAKVVTRFEGNNVYLYKVKFILHPENIISHIIQWDKNTKIFTYDFLYDSDERSPSFASQEKIFNDLGQDVLKAAFEGFNTCVFAYGQTGSGKSYTMMGHAEQKGLIPQICVGLFSKISDCTSGRVSFRTEVSFMEIYNERVHDLLKKRTAATENGNLRVREHPRDGPYVENLSKHLVHSYSDVEELIAAGNINRITVSTGMNDSSSRSHAIFTINFTQAWFDAELPREMLSKIHLVDLAGSERANVTHTSGIRLKEGANINKSLVTLGNVISALAELSVGQPTTKRATFIPYRDSVLTWLLKDSLGGNSKTTMIATISPADLNYGETLSTLRYASRAQSIMNTPTVNEDKSVSLIRELQAEVIRLKRLLVETKQVTHRELSSSLRVEEELHENEEKVYTLTKEWTCKWEETRGIMQEEPVALKKKGSAVVLDCRYPHLIGLDEDLLSTGIVLYYLKEGRTMINTNKTTHCLDIEDCKPEFGGEHCVFENHAGTVTVIPHEDAMCSVNGTVITHPCQLTQAAGIDLKLPSQVLCHLSESFVVPRLGFAGASNEVETTNSLQLKQDAPRSLGSSSPSVESSLQGQLSCGDKDGFGSLEDSVTHARVYVEAAVQSSRLSVFVKKEILGMSTSPARNSKPHPGPRRPHEAPPTTPPAGGQWQPPRPREADRAGDRLRGRRCNPPNPQPTLGPGGMRGMTPGGTSPVSGTRRRGSGRAVPGGNYGRYTHTTQPPPDSTPSPWGKF
nr:kinesin-like protein KIF16B [Nerophis lumbriciformis]